MQEDALVRHRRAHAVVHGVAVAHQPPHVHQPVEEVVHEVVQQQAAEHLADQVRRRRQAGVQHARAEEVRERGEDCQ